MRTEIKFFSISYLSFPDAFSRFMNTDDSLILDDRTMSLTGIGWNPDYRNRLKDFVTTRISNSFVNYINKGGKSRLKRWKILLGLFLLVIELKKPRNTKLIER